MAMQKFGERLRELREGSKKRLKDLADAMGCSVVYASDVELGRRTPPSTEKILKIARFLKTDPKELLNLADSARRRIELDLNDSKPKHAKAALLLARSWENLTDDEVERLEQDLESILNRRGN
jgi:transcriptional regulator with XRE-family HTH domain